MNSWPDVSVPVMAGLFRRYEKDYLEQLKRVGAGMVFLAPERCFDPARYQREMDDLRYGLSVLEKEGFACGAWIQSFGFGIPMNEHERNAAPFTRIKAPDGSVCGTLQNPGDAFCPLDPGYLRFCTNQAQDCVKAGARIVMLDDDLCLSVRPSLGCCCPAHMKLYEKRLGRRVRREDIWEMVYAGKPSRARTLWLELMGETLKDFCRAIRKAVDAIDPTVRVGYCAGFTSWDLEGADAMELTEILAGENRPFLRCTGAPYWYQMKRFSGQSIPHIAEFTRMQAHWIKERDVDAFTENDSYPRPRYKIPASHIEGFEFAMRAAGENRSLKYLFDYFSSPCYETGYVQAHLRHKKLFDAMTDYFSARNQVGISVHAPMRRMAEMNLPEPFAGAAAVMETVSFQNGANFLSGLGIPTTYGDASVVIAFGDGGRTVPRGHGGYILDAVAAQHLMERGMDPGILGLEELKDAPNTEYFVGADDAVQLGEKTRWPGCWYSAELSPKAELVSEFVYGDDFRPGSFTYTDSRGVRYYVILAQMDGVVPDGALYRSYHRQESIVRFAREAGSPIRASLNRCPGSYVTTCEKNGLLAAAIGNFHDDAMEAPCLQLDREYARAYCLGLDGQRHALDGLEGNVLRLPSLAAWDFAVILLEESDKNGQNE